MGISAVFNFMRLSAIFGGLVLVGPGLLGVSTALADETTTVFIVRHAEQLADGSDPSLSLEGQLRAQALAARLEGEGIDAIYVTHFARTQETAIPTAERTGIIPTIHPAGDRQIVVDSILEHHGGGRVLVVAHSNTVGDIARGLGAEDLSDLGHDQYDQLFVVYRTGSEVRFVREHYGASTP